MNKQIVLAVLGLSSLVGLMGCEQKEKVPAVTAVATETQPAQPVEQAVKIVAKIEPANYRLPECKGTNCPEISLMKLTSNQTWLDQLVNAQVLKTVQQLVDMPALEQIQVADASTDSTELQSYVNQLLALSDEIQALGANHQINVMVSPKLIQEEAPIATVAVVSSSYLGGAHGSSHQQYLNFDLNQKHQIQLEDVIQSGQKKSLEKAAYQVYQQWVKEIQEVDETSEYEQMWPFELTDNFYLGAHGLVLQYAEYEIGPYVVGLPRLTIPYAQLIGILKPTYLPENAKK